MFYFYWPLTYERLKTTRPWCGTALRIMMMTAPMIAFGAETTVIINLPARDRGYLITRIPYKGHCNNLGLCLLWKLHASWPDFGLLFCDKREEINFPWGPKKKSKERALKLLLKHTAEVDVIETDSLQGWPEVSARSLAGDEQQHSSGWKQLPGCFFSLHLSTTSVTLHLLF